MTSVGLSRRPARLTVGQAQAVAAGKRRRGAKHVSGCRSGAPDGELIAHQWRLSIKEKTTAGEQLKEFGGDKDGTFVTADVFKVAALPAGDWGGGAEPWPDSSSGLTAAAERRTGSRRTGASEDTRGIVGHRGTIRGHLGGIRRQSGGIRGQSGVSQGSIMVRGPWKV